MTEARSSRTAAHRRGGVGAALGAWVRAHWRALLDILSRFPRAPVTHLLTAAVMGIALALPLGLYVLLENVEAVSARWTPHAHRLSLFLKSEVDDAEAAVLAKRLATFPGAGSVQLVSRAQALEEYRRQAGAGEVLELLGENPLPAVLLVEPASGTQARLLVEELERVAEVESVRFDMEWLLRLQAITAVARRAVEVIAAIFAAAVLLVVGHAVRMAVAQRREEIEVVKLFGATDAFVRRPFLYTGLCYGLLSGVFACAVVTAAVGALQGPIAGLTHLYQSGYALEGLTWRAMLAVCLGSGVLSVVAAWWTAGGNIQDNELK